MSPALRLRMALVGALLVLAALPALSRAASDAYTGDLTTPHTTPNGVTSGIRFNVILKKNDRGKRVPTFVRRFESRVVPMYCEDGSIAYQDGFFPHPTLEVPIRKRKFEDSVNNGGDRFEITGQIPKSGPASGTIRMFSAAFSDVPNCDSGVVSWTATTSG